MNHLELFAEALDYMEHHLEDDIKTGDVAKACGCSKSTLEKLFCHAGLTTVGAYITRRRMMKAGRLLMNHPQLGILDAALQYGYESNEAFTRAFKKVWNCKPSEFREQNRYSELYPRLHVPLEDGDVYMKERKPVDISELYDLFQERRECYFVCCDIKGLIPFNEISRKAGDMAILEAMHRMNEAAGAEDAVFRIGGDEFALLTDSEDIRYAEQVAEQIRTRNGQCITFEERQLPLELYVGVTRVGKAAAKYNELFTKLHTAIREITFHL